MKRAISPPIRIRTPSVSSACVFLYLSVCFVCFCIWAKFQLLNECNGILFIVLYSVSFFDGFWLRARKLRCRLRRHRCLHSYERAFTPLYLISPMHTVCFALILIRFSNEALLFLLLLISLCLILWKRNVNVHESESNIFHILLQSVFIPRKGHTQVSFEHFNDTFFILSRAPFLSLLLLLFEESKAWILYILAIAHAMTWFLLRAIHFVRWNVWDYGTT